MSKGNFQLTKFQAPIIAIATAGCLATFKATVGFLTGSLVILGSAIDSMMDVFTSLMNFIMIKQADRPADEEHPFGHGKLEAYASLMQSIIIFGIGVYLIYKAYGKFQTHFLSQVELVSFLVMLVSIVGSLSLSIMLKRVAKRENSQALHADSMHYTMDLATNIGVLVTLALIKITGVWWIDPLIAVIIGIYIIKQAVELHLSALNVLIDRRPDDDIQKQIIGALELHNLHYPDYHRLRTRTDGSKIFVDMHLTLCNKLSLIEAHTLCNTIENEIKSRFDNIDVIIHPDPCEYNCGGESCTNKNVQALISDFNLGQQKHDV